MQARVGVLKRSTYELARDGHAGGGVDRQDKAAIQRSFSNAGVASPECAYT
jgi:hypothetical protein